MGGANKEAAEITQSYTIPAAGGTLSYVYKITSTDSCGYDYGYVKVNNTNLKTYNLCSSNATNGFVQGSTSLSAYAGQTVTLKFRATTDISRSSSFYIDNVTFAAAAIVEEPDPYASDELATPEPKTDTPQGVTEERESVQIFLPLLVK